MDPARQGGEESQLGEMRFSVQQGLLQVGDAPALGDIEAEEGAQLRRRLPGHGVAPGAEGDEELARPVEGQVAVHHGGDADGPHGAELFAQLPLRVLPEVGKTGLQALFRVLQGIGPDPVLQLVFPGIAAGSHGPVLFIQQHGLDPGAPQLDPQDTVRRRHAKGFSVR